MSGTTSTCGRLWPDCPPLTEADFDRDYAALLSKGRASCHSHRYQETSLPREPIEPSPPPEEWRTQVALPWWAALQTRVEKDGLRIVTHLLYSDWEWWDEGVPNYWAVAELAKPEAPAGPPEALDPYRYPKGIRLDELMLQDWGETLISARKRAGVGGGGPEEGADDGPRA